MVSRWSCKLTIVGTTSRVCRRAWNLSTSPLTIASAFSASFVRSDRLLQIVDVIDKNAIDLVHLRIDVPGNGDVDKEHGLVLAQRHELLAVFAPEDEVWRASRCNHDVGAIGGVIKPAELDRLAVKLLC